MSCAQVVAGLLFRICFGLGRLNGKLLPRGCDAVTDRLFWSRSHLSLIADRLLLKVDRQTDTPQERESDL